MNQSLTSLIVLAETSANANSSALFCLSQAKQLFSSDEQSARMWAIRSLKYSLGVLNPIFKTL
jgi:hypothetical protein